MNKREKDIIHDGVCIARLSLSLPETGNERADRFYRALADRSVKWFEERIAPMALEEYMNSQDERKKWRWQPMVFRINSSISEHDNGRAKRKICRLEVFYSNNGKNVGRITRNHVWDTDRCRLLKIQKN